jgi:hypothetical protein
MDFVGFDLITGEESRLSDDFTAEKDSLATDPGENDTGNRLISHHNLPFGV